MDGFKPRFTSHMQQGVIHSMLVWNKFALATDKTLCDPVSCSDATTTQWDHFKELRAAFWRYLGAA